MKRLFVIFMLLWGCVEEEKENPWWEPECSSDLILESVMNGAEKCAENDETTWETRCLYKGGYEPDEQILQMCVCGLWETVHICSRLFSGGQCTPWEWEFQDHEPIINLFSCSDHQNMLPADESPNESEDGIGQGALACGFWKDAERYTLPYLCYYFPESYCARDFENGLCSYDHSVH